MTPLPTAILDELEKALEAASPAPWADIANIENRSRSLVCDLESDPGFVVVVGRELSSTNAKLIRLLVNNAQTLLAAARERDELKRKIDLCKRAVDIADKLNAASTDKQAELSTSFHEAVTLDLLDKAEAENATLAEQLHQANGLLDTYGTEVRCVTEENASLVQQAADSATHAEVEAHAHDEARRTIAELVQQRDKWREDAQRLATNLSHVLDCFLDINNSTLPAPTSPLNGQISGQTFRQCHENISLHTALESSNAEKGREL